MRGLAGLGLLVVWIASAATAADRSHMSEPFEITADVIRYEADRELYVAEGHVHILQQQRRLEADWVAFSKKTGIGVADGDVDLVDGADRLQSAFMVFDVETLQGTLYQVALDSGSDGFRMRAKEMIRTGRNTFTVDDAVFTTCRCEPGKRLPWEIETGRADVELGGYAQLKNSTFDVLGVPVLWIPWMLVPVKSDRETGLLLPDFAFGGRGGPTIGVPFFWAARPELNVTLTPRYFVNRGFKQDVELDYVFGRESAGRLFVAGLYDHTDQARESFNRRRWSLLWDHDQALPARLRWQTDVRLASDNLYSDDFPEMQRYRTFRFNESTTQIGRDFGDSGGFGMMLGARYADDLQGTTKDDRDEAILQRFAELRGDAQPGSLSGPLGIDARIDSELIHFRSLRNPRFELEPFQPPAGAPIPIPASRRDDGRFFDFGFDGRFDDAAGVNGEGDGVFQPGEPLDESGTRLVLHPRLARPFALGRFLELVPEIGWSQSLYQSDSQQFAERGLATARAELRSRLERDFIGQEGGALRHVIEPRLSWAFVKDDWAGRDQRHNPLFVPATDVQQIRFRTLSLESVTRDPSDRIEDANQVVLALGQRFFSRRTPDALPRLRADLVTAVDWDFEGDGGLGHVVAEGRWFSIGRIGSRLRGAYNPESNVLREGEAEVSVGLPLEDSWVRRLDLSTRYRYLARLPEFFESVRGDPFSQRSGDTALNQFDMNARLELTARVRLSYRAVYSLAEKEGFLRNRAMFEYVSKCRCWGFATEVFQERRADFGFGFQIRFLGLGDEEGNLFDGGIGAGMNF